MKHSIFAIFVFLLSGCQLLIPDPPPPETPILMPNDYAWDELDIAKDYTYIQTPRIDCGQMMSAVSSTGRCVPVKRPYGSVITCPLEPPASMLEIGCLDHDDVPDILIQLKFENSAESVDFSSLGSCLLVGEGPAADEPPRFKTDIGYKACLFETLTPPGQLVSSTKQQRPGGFYLDLSQNPKSVDDLKHQASSLVFDGPFTLVLDTTFLDNATRSEAFNHVNRIFDFYRSFAKPEPPESTE